MEVRKVHPILGHVLASVLGLLSVLVAAFVAMSPVHANKDKILLGVSLELTGQFSTEAADVQRAYRMWMEEVNAEGGIYVEEYGRRLPLELIEYDSRSDTGVAVRNYRRLIERDRVDLLLSPWGSGINYAVTSVTEAAKYPLILTAASSDTIFERGFRYIFGSNATASFDASIIADFLEHHRDVFQRIAIAYENFLFTTSFNEHFLREMDGSDIEIIANERYALAQQEFSDVLAKFRGADPDAVLLMDVMPSGIYFTQQMHQMGLTPRMYYMTVGPQYREVFIEALGPAAEGAFERGIWDEDLPFEGAKEFPVRFQERYGVYPSMDAVFGYTAVQLLQQAVEVAGTLDRERINEVLHSHRFETIQGPFEFNERGQNTLFAGLLAQVQDGKRVIVWPEELATAPPRFRH